MVKQVKNMDIYRMKRILICGMGSIGMKHSEVIQMAMPKAEIYALRSTNKKVPNKDISIKEEFVDIVEAIKSKPDAAIIATPASEHLAQALILAKNGIPLLIEKPIGTGDESPKLWQELKILSKKVKIQIGYVLRHDKCAIELKNMLKSNYMGKIIEADFYCGSWLPEWRANSDYRESVSSKRDLGGGALLELSHEIDLAIWLLGEIKVEFARLRNSKRLDIDVEDQVIIVGKDKYDKQVSIRLNFCSFPARRKILIRTEEGEISWNLLKQKLEIFDKNDKRIKRVKSYNKPEEKYKQQFKSFANYVGDKEECSCSVDDGIRVIELCNKIKAIQKSE